MKDEDGYFELDEEGHKVRDGEKEKEKEYNKGA